MVYPFGEVEDRVSILSPLLYDPFRGDTVNKDLYHTAMVTHASFELDKLEVERALIFLCEENEIGRLMLRLSEDSTRNESFLSEIASRLEKKGIEKDRLILAYSSLSLAKKEVKYAVKKSKSLGFKVGVYEYGGERIDTLAELGIEYASMKTELVRPSANKELLSSLVSALRGMNITVLIEKGKLGDLVIGNRVFIHGVNFASSGVAYGAIPGFNPHYFSDITLARIAEETAMKMGEIRAIRGDILSGEKKIVDQEEFTSIFLRHYGSMGHLLCYDCTSGGVALASTIAKVPFLPIKAITYLPLEGEEGVLKERRISLNANINAAKLILEIMKQEEVAL